MPTNPVNPAETVTKTFKNHGNGMLTVDGLHTGVKYANVTYTGGSGFATPLDVTAEITILRGGTSVIYQNYEWYKMPGQENKWLTENYRNFEPDIVNIGNLPSPVPYLANQTPIPPAETDYDDDVDSGSSGGGSRDDDDDSILQTLAGADGEIFGIPQEYVLYGGLGLAALAVLYMMSSKK